MKIRISNYTFDKTAKTVTFTDYTSIALDGILLVTNVTDNIIIYNFADSTLGGTVTNNVLTLDYDTSSMDNADALQIFYEDSDKADITYDLIVTLNELNSRLTAIASLVSYDSNLRVKAMTGSTTVVTGTTTVADATTQASMAPATAKFVEVLASQNNLAVQSNINNVSVI